MLKKSIKLIAALTIFLTLSSCQKIFPPYATTDEQWFTVHSAGILLPPANIKPNAYSLTYKNKKIFFTQFTPAGKLTLKKDLSQLFNKQFNYDSLIAVDLYKVNNLVAVYQNDYDQFKPWRIILIDTTGKIKLLLSDTVRDTSSLFQYKYHIMTIASPNFIKAYYYTTDTNNNNYLYIQQYSLNGQFQKFYYLQDSNLTHSYPLQIFRQKYALLLLNRNPKTNAFYIDRISPNDQFKYWPISNSIYIMNVTSLSQDSVLFTFASYEQTGSFFMILYNFNSNSQIWKLSSSTLVDFIPTFITKTQMNNYIILGFKWLSPKYLFTYKDVPKYVGNFYAISFDGSNIIWKKQIFGQRLIPLGAIPASDTVYTSFSLGKTFNAFYATYIVKFSIHGKTISL